MSKLIKSAASGGYEPIGSLIDADCVIGHSFGTSTATGSVNQQLAVMAAAYTNVARPLIIDRTLELALPRLTIAHPASIYEGPVSDTISSRGGTMAMLLHAKKLMDKYDLKRPLTIAQAFHAGRVALQSKKLGMEPILPEGLPRDFAPDSGQWWTRSRAMWVPRELAGMIALKMRGEL
jgi:hypothetical protein